ncbi:uncharacterized protein Bfra_001555 [Botrytis fragariae]|uniref:Uncharacterized protein n=1 Tax=Botrytis fragariae TaxID=1964551 RepID=A0A8H6B162_9HELO|nr:uncharacterized protein Bfra_001555 [Botrytis fragariae]KAF5877192.1 hypothetical protein Bfra_001555 [Botrytis fragariae]
MEEVIEKLTKERDYYDAMAKYNMEDIIRLAGERDILSEELRKFRVQSSSPRKALGQFSNIWDDSLWDSDSFNRFELLRADIFSWSKREVKELSHLDDIQDRDRELFFGEAAKVVLLDGSDKQEFPNSLRGRRRTLLHVLGALLTHHLYATVFSDPFFFLGEETSQILNDIMSLGNSWNLGHAQRWRGDTLRLIHPLHKTPDETMVKSETNKLLRNAAVSGATKFMRSPAKYIMNNNPDALQGLEGLYIKAAEHAYLIWCRRPMIKLLDSTSFLGQPYDPHNSEMVLHRTVASGGGIEPQGQPISLVTSPAILRYGLRVADDGIYEERWWHEVYGYQRACVWVHLPRPEELDSDEEDFTPMALSPPPEQLKDLKPVTFPRRSDLSVEDLGERMLKRFDRVTLLDLVKPYLDDLAEQLRPVLEGLREEIAQRIEERDEMEKQRDEFRSKYREALQSIERLKSGM